MNKKAKHFPRKLPKSSTSTSQSKAQISGSDEDDYVERSQLLAYRGYYDKALHLPILKAVIHTDDEKLRLWKWQDEVKLKDDVKSDGGTLRTAANQLLAQPIPTVPALPALPDRKFSVARFESKSHKIMAFSMPLLQALNLMHGYLPVDIAVGITGNTNEGIAGNTGSGIGGNTVPVSASLSQAQPEPAGKASAAPGFIAGCLHWLSEAGRAISDAIAYYDPLKMPIPGASAAPAVESREPACHSVDVNAYAGLPAANAYVARLLCIGLPDDIGLSEFLLRAIRFQDKDQKKHMALVSAIQQGYGLYGGHVEETMSEAYSNEVMRKWLSDNIFGGDMNAFIIGRVLANPEGTMNIAHLDSIVTRENLLDKGGAYGQLRLWMFGKVIGRELPILRYLSGSESDKIGNLKLHDWDWGLINAGLLFARSTGWSDTHTISSEQALGLGKMLLAQLAEGAVSAQWKYFFKLPAMVRYMMEVVVNSSNVVIGNLSLLVDGALDEYFSAYELRRIKSDPFENFDYLFKKGKSRRDTAIEYLSNKCAGANLDEYLSGFQTYCEILDLDTPEGRAEKKSLENHILVVLDNISHALRPPPAETAVNTARLLRMNISADQAGFYLENIDELYDRQNKEIAQAYGNRDKLLILDALGRLAEDECNFIAGAEVRRLRVEFSALDVFRKTAIANTPEFQTKYVIPLDQEVDFYQAINGHEKRIFALEIRSNQSRFIRVDEDRSNFYPFLGANKRPLHDNSFALKIYPFNSVVNAALKRADQPIDEAFISQIVATREESFRKKLHDAGYEKTFKAEVRDFLLSLIPFYSCVTSSIAGKPEEATVSCFVDVASLVPVAGRLVGLSGKFSQMLAVGGLTTMRNAMAETAARQSIRATMKKAGSDFAQHGIKPALGVFSEKNIVPVLKGLSRSLDPGVEFGAHIGKASMKQAVKLGKSVKELFPDSVEMLEKMERIVTNIPLPVPKDQYVMAKIRHQRGEVAVTRLGGARYEKKPVYVEIDLQTGEVFGQKYTLSNNGKRLEPIPVESARQLKNHRKSPAHGSGQQTIGQSEIRYTPGVKKSAFQQVQDGAVHELGYDLESNLFYRDVSGTDQRLWFSLEPVDDVYKLMELSDKKAKQLRKRSSHIKDETRIKTLENAGMDLGLTVDKKGRPIVRSIAPVYEIPRQLISIWVGKSAIPQTLIDNINRNAETVKQCQGLGLGLGEFRFKLYLSADSPTWFDPAQRMRLKNVELIELETSDVFKQFQQTNSYEQYQAALTGNTDVLGGRSHYASAADVLRVYVLDKEGGIYMDLDDTVDKLLAKMSLALGAEQIMLGARFDNPGMGMTQMFGNAVFGTHPGNPVMTRLLDAMMVRFKNNPNFYRSWYTPDFYRSQNIPMPSDLAKQISDMTGPGVFNEVIGSMPDVQHYLAANRFLMTIDRDTLYALRDTPLLKVINQQATENPLTRLAKVNLPGSAHSWESSR